MKITNLKLPHQNATSAEPAHLPAVPERVSGDGAAVSLAGASVRQIGDAANPGERQTLEIAMLRARIQHLELVVETARSLMGSNQEKLLRRLHEMPREMAALSVQLHRIDPNSIW